MRCAADSEVLYRNDYGKLGAIPALLRAAHRLQPDLIYVELFAYSGLVGAIVAKALWGCRIGVGNGDDVFGTHWKGGRPVRAVFAGAFDLFLRRYADLWAVWSPYYHAWLRRRGVANVVCAPGAVNLDAVRRGDGTPVRRRLGFTNHLVVGVVGNLQYSRRLDMVFGWDLIAALAELRDANVRGLIVGDGPGLPRLRQMAEQLGVADLIALVGHVPHQELNPYYSAMDVGLVTLSNDLDAKFTWTAKLPEYLACNIFPVVTDVERSRRFVTRCGALLPFSGAKDPLYPKRLAGLLRNLAADPALLARRDEGRRLAQGLMTFDVSARHLERGIKRALDRGR